MRINNIPQGTVEELDPELNHLIKAEDRRQAVKVILIPSESIAPPAVRDLMSSNFGNVYAEGYPRQEDRQKSEQEILDLDAELAYFRRYSDPRYYKGVEYADVLESLCRRRAAELFCTDTVSPDALYVNVQPLSGSPANSAVYGALLEPGDTVMGLDLIDGGHLTHGSPVNRSGRLYNFVPYHLNLETEQLDFEAIEQLAIKNRPKLIVAGFTAYPLIVDWNKFRVIADKVGAYLMADIAHISGLVAAGVHPTPVGIADVVTTTTHKSLCGPRGAMILTHKPEIGRKIDRSVFPGEQGGPHLNTIAALALALKLAKSDDFRNLQRLVVRNSARLARQIDKGGIRVVAGGSENHLLLLDMKSIKNKDVHLSGDMAARILDIAGIVTNRNTIPGDPSVFAASGVRLGTVWISQLGFQDDEIDKLAEAITSLLNSCQPFAYPALGGKHKLRAKVQPESLHKARQIVADLVGHDYPQILGTTMEIRGEFASELLNFALTSNVTSLQIGESQASHIIGPEIDTTAVLFRQSETQYLMHIPAGANEAARVSRWLKDLSDGYVKFDDTYAKLPGPVVSKLLLPDDKRFEATKEDTPEEKLEIEKPFFIGMHQLRSVNAESLPEFVWEEKSDEPLKRTSLYQIHVEMGGRMVPFAGWDMPVWYSSVSDEHKAVRKNAGLFDVSHMGVLEASGPHASEFLNLVTTNDINGLEVGRSHYTYLLDSNGNVVDDLLVYRLGRDRYMMVVNAANNDKDWAWLNAVNEGRVLIDNERPWAKVQNRAILRDLRDPQWGDECLVDIALQGPNSRKILSTLCEDESLKDQITKLPWAGLISGKLSGIDAIISRTGYTGERVAYELFVHPDEVSRFWRNLIEAGSQYDLVPCGLAARDSTRTEAGLPLYGHELSGPLDLNPANAGFASYVKLWKPFFIGRKPYLKQYENLTDEIVRFRMNEKGVRRPELGDPVLDKRGKIIGTVTSCAIDQEGYLLGQALVPLDLSKQGTDISIYQLGGGTRQLPSPTAIRIGGRLPVPSSATVLSRFPKTKK